MIKNIATASLAGICILIAISMANCLIVSNVTDSGVNYGILQASIPAVPLRRVSPHSPGRVAPAHVTLPTDALAHEQYHEYAGVIHVHTDYSDGSGSYEYVAGIADSLGLDFIIPTDHNTLEPIRDGWARRFGNILIIPGVEHSMDNGAGHYLAIGDSLALVRSSSVPSDSVYRRTVTPDNLIFLAHVFHPCHNSWRDWSLGGYTGMEIFNLDENWREAIHPFRFNRFIAGALMYPYHNRAIEYIISHPEKQLAKFDTLNMNRKIIAIGSTDAHAKRLIGGCETPSYASMFKIVQTVVMTPEPFDGEYGHDRNLVLDALKEGHSYVGFPCYGKILGFLFTARSDSSVAVCGDSLRIGQDTQFRVMLPDSRNATMQVVRNGEVIREVSGIREWEWTSAEPGVYRIQVFQERRQLPLMRKRRFPWILSNPIYVWEKPELVAMTTP